MSVSNKTRLAIAFGLAAAGGLSASAFASHSVDHSNPFAAASLSSGYVVDDARVGEGKCGA